MRSDTRSHERSARRRIKCSCSRVVVYYKIAAARRNEVVPNVFRLSNELNRIGGIRSTRSEPSAAAVTSRTPDRRSTAFQAVKSAFCSLASRVGRTLAPFSAVGAVSAALRVCVQCLGAPLQPCPARSSRSQICILDVVICPGSLQCCRD